MLRRRAIAIVLTTGLIVAGWVGSQFISPWPVGVGEMLVVIVLGVPVVLGVLAGGDL